MASVYAADILPLTESALCGEGLDMRKGAVEGVTQRRGLDGRLVEQHPALERGHEQVGERDGVGLRPQTTSSTSSGTSAATRR